MFKRRKVEIFPKKWTISKAWTALRTGLKMQKTLLFRVKSQSQAIRLAWNMEKIKIGNLVWI